MIRVISLLICSIFLSNLLANESLQEGSTDIIERLINFVIFVALLWYLVAGKIKGMLTERSKTIAKRLNDAQEKIRKSHQVKEDAKLRLKQAQERATEIVAAAKKEALVVVKRIEDENKEQIEYLMRANDEAMKFEIRASNRLVISEVLDELFKKDSLKLSANDYMNIINKKML